ncbi:ATP phosphoribosyltransferase regulatory subunit [Candidatus Methylopumilus universalis]|uniref:ATP phosphoribosyltransferase regulatory subunit n=1 Tax=Candidatus Methylopumilus universalis TaxID=2588536 RepID=UPI00167DB237|nr:ATP phosphoribosyltransferase regulatory subunit [Candidatus Methylopumilus universalis]
MNQWTLPDYVEDMLPDEAVYLESLRRSILDLYQTHGYLYVIPPMLEYIESLNGNGQDMDLDTFKVVDQLTGRLMGVRADITPQVARIDAHLIQNDEVTRLSYAGSVLRTKPASFLQSREPFQIGAELYGFKGIEADLEIQTLLIKTLSTIGIQNPVIDFNHLDIFTSLIASSNMERDQLDLLYQAMQKKDKSEVIGLTKSLDKKNRDALIELVSLYGDVNVLEEAEKLLPQDQAIKSALQFLNQLDQALKNNQIKVSYDLSDIRGYQYHNGLVFSVYADQCYSPIALGGRYDNIGAPFGRNRPATGFTMDLKNIVTLFPNGKKAKAILAPQGSERDLQNAIESLRQQGETVAIDLFGDMNAKQNNCDRILMHDANKAWKVKTV